MRLQLSACVLLAAASVPAAAASVDINLSGDSIEGRYSTGFGLGEMTVGGLYNHDSRDWAANIGLLAMGESNNSGSRFDGGLGGKLYAVSVGSAHVLALGLGGHFHWFPGSSSFGLGGYAFFAPGIVTMLDGRTFRELGVRAEVELVRNSTLYIGYREVRAEIDGGAKLNVDKGSVIGIQIKF
jgi:hypothetical protein